MRIERREIFKNKAVLIVVSAFLALTNCRIAAFAGDLPVDPLVKAGNPAITSDGTNMTVNAGTAAKTYIDWQGGFNIGAANSVNNIAAEASAVILHHDVSGALSNIQGALNGNCNVFLLNPSGILFGAGAQVNVAGLVVSTLNLSVSDFLKGNYVLDQGGNASGIITNAGTITATGPMGVTLAGGAVRNEGVINAGPLGTVNLVSGSQVTLNADSEGLIQVAVDGQVLDNVYDKDGNKVEFGVDNVGQINANGGEVYIEAEAANDVFTKLINQEGVVKAGSMVNKGGKIVLVSNSEGIVENSGTLDVSGVEDGASGGTIEMNGSTVGQLGTAKADAKGDGNGGDITLYAGDTVALSSGSLTTANAGSNGNGGTITVYSPDTALFRNGAKIEAKGGSISGDGGFVEVSGKEYFEICGLVDTRAANGLTGTFLIDPYNVTISSAADANPISWPGTPYSPTGSGANINVTTLETQLGLTNVEVTTGASGGEEGDITVSDALSWNSAYSLTLTAADDIAINATITNTGSGGLTLTAGDRIDVAANVTLSGGNFTATSTAAATGIINVSSGVVVNVGSGNMTLTSDVLWLQATPAEFAGTGALTLQPYTSSSSIGLAGAAGTWGLTQDHLTGFMNGGFSSLTIGKAGGTHAITVNALTLADPLTLRGGSVTIDGALATTGALTLTSSGAVDINNTITTNGGAFNSSGTTFDNTGGSITTGGGNVVMNHSGTVTAGANIDAGTGDVDITVTSANTGIVLNGDAQIEALDVTLSVGQVVLSSGWISGTNTVTIKPYLNGDAIDLGSASDGNNNTLEISDTEIDNITAGTLRIGSASAGAVTLTGSISPAGASILHLLSNSTVTGTSYGITDTSLAVTAAGAVTLTAANDVDNIAIDTSTGNIQFTDSDGFTVTTVDGVTGIDTDSGSVTLTATTGNITVANTGVANDIDATSSITITASADNASFTLDSTADIRSTGGAVTISADDMDLSGTITAGGQIVTLKSTTAGDEIYLGTNPGTANVLELSDAEIDNITAGTLRIGSASAGAVTLTGSISPAGASVLHLTSASTVTENSSCAITETSLAVSAGGAVTLTAANDVDNIAINTTSGNIRFTDPDGFTVTTVDGVTGISTSHGDIYLLGDSMTISQAITASGEVNIEPYTSGLPINLGTAIKDGTTLGFSVSELALISATTVNIGSSSSSSAIIISSDQTYTKDFSLVTSNIVTFDANIIVNSGYNLTVTADDVDIASGKTLTVSGTGNITLQPYLDDEDINLGYDTSSPPVGGFNLTTVEMRSLVTGASGSVIIGREGGNGAITIGEGGDVDLSAASIYSLKLNGGTATIDNVLTLRDSATLEFDLTGALVDNCSDTYDIIISSGTLNITAYGGVGSSNALETAVGNISVLNNDVDGSTSNVLISNTGALTLNGAANNDGGDIEISAASPLVISADVIATGNGDITLSNSGTGDITINEDVQLRGELGDIYITSANSNIVVQNNGTGILIQTGGNGGVVLTATAGDITLGDGTAGSSLLINLIGTGTVAINAYDDIALARIVTAGGPVTVDATGSGDADVVFYGAVNSSSVNLGAVSSSGSLTVNARNITVSGALESTASFVDINSTGTLDVNSAISAFTTLALDSDTAAMTLSGINLTANGNISINDAVTLDTGAVTVSSANGNVTFSGTINGGYNLTVNSDNGTVTLGGIIGDSVGLNALTVTAGVLIDVNDAITNADSVTFYGNSDIGADITATAGAITLNGSNNTISGGARTLTASTYIDVNGDISGAQNLTLAGTNNVMIRSIGLGADPTLLDINTTALQLEGDITVDGNVRFNGAVTTTLAADVTIDTIGGGNGTIVDFAALNGNHALTIAGGDADISFAGVTQLTALTVSSSDTMDFTGVVSMPGSINVTAAESATDAIDVQNAIDSTAGSVTFNGNIYLAADASAGEDIVVNGNITLGLDRILTANKGDINLNGTVNGAFSGQSDLVLNALKGTVYAQAMGTSYALEDLEINSLAAELSGNIVAISVNTTGVGLATLTNNITITASGASGILLGDLAGSKALTLVASNASGVITLNNANIGSLSVTDSATVNFNGDLVTSGVVTVYSASTPITGTITVASGKSIQAAGAVTLTTSSTSAGAIVNNGTISGDSVALTAGSGGTITLHGNVNSVNEAISFANAVTLTGSSLVSSANDAVTFSGDVSGGFELTVISGDTVTFDSTIGNGDDLTALTITADHINFGDAVNVGALTVNGSGGTTTISADITSAGAIEIYDNVVISGARILTADNNHIYISGTINATAAATDSLTLAAGSGNVTLMNSVGNSVTLEDLTITSTGTTTLNGTITVDGNLAGEDIDLDGATNVVLGSDVTLDSARDVLLEAVNGQGHDLIVIAGLEINLNDAITNVLNVAMKSVSSLSLDYAVTALQDATFTTTAVGSDITVGAALTAGTSLTITADTSNASSYITLGSSNDLEALAVTLKAGTIQINSEVNNSAGSIHLIAPTNGTDAGNNITAYGDLIIDGEVGLSSGSREFTSTNGDIRLNYVVDSLYSVRYGLTLHANRGTIYAGTLGGTSWGYGLGALFVTAQQLVLNGSIEAKSVDTSGVGLTTLAAGTVDMDSTGWTSINLGALTGANNLTISAGTTVTLADADIASLTIDAGSAVTFNGDFVTSGAVSVTGVSGTTTITDATGSIQAGGAVTLSAGTVTNNELISGNSVSVTGSTVINLNGNVNSVNGLTIFNNAVTLTGNTVASSANGNVTFSGDVSGNYTLEADAAAGTVTFSSTIGNGTDPVGLTVNADNLTLNGAVNVDGNIDVNANSVTFAAGSGTIDTSTTNGYIDFNKALMDAASGASITLSLNSGSGNVVLGTIGSSDPVASLAVTSTGTTTLNGNITVDSGNITLSNATDVNLAANVTLTATGDILLNGGAVDGGYALSVYSTGSITVDAIGQNVPLTSLVLNAGGTIAINDNISVNGPVLIETAGGSGDNITIGGNVIGSSVTFDARSAGIITVNTAQNNTLGSTTFNGLVTLKNNIAALDDITFSTYGVTLDTDVSITSTNGDIDLNGAVDSSSGNTYNFTLTADSGTVYAQTIGTSVSVNVLDINADYAQLNGNIAAISVDTTGVGLTTLTNDISITASGSAGILLGDLTGARDLTLTASDPNGVITLLDANVGSLTIDDAYTVDFNGNFAVNGAVSVTGVGSYIQVATTGSIQAGGAVTLNALGSVNSYVDNYGAITAGGNIDIQANDYVSVDADITTSGIGTIYINADADDANSGTYEAFYIGYTGEASITSENGDITIIGGNVYVGYNEDGQVVTTGTGNINIDLSSSAAGVGTIDIYTENVESGISAGGAVNIGQNNAPDSLTMEDSFIRAQGNITTDSGDFNMDSGSNVTSYAGDIDIGTSSGDMTVDGNITAVGHTVTLNSNGYIYDTSDDNTYIKAWTLDLSAGSGIGSGTGDDALDTEVDYITASVSGTGAIYILEQNGVTLTSVSTNDGLINITTGDVTTGNTIVTSVVAGGTANVDITATRGDIYLATVTAAGDTATITASNGSIYDDDINSTKITADTVDLNAAGNIGLSGTDRDIDTACTTLNADTTGPGDIYVTDDDAVTLNSVTTTAGSITVKSARSANGNMTVTLVTAGGDNADVTLQTLAGAGGSNDIGLSGPVTAADDDITLIADGSVTDNYTGGADLVSKALYLQAGGSVGASGNYIDTQVSTIDDVAGGGNVSGNIYILEYDGVDLGSINGLTTDAGNIFITANGTSAGSLVASSIIAGGSGDIYLTSGNSSDIALGYVNALGDDVTLVSANNITDEDTDSAIDIVADHLYLQAAGYCGTSGTDAGIDTDVTYIDNVASNVVVGAIYINENDGVNLGSTNGLTSTNGPIYITAANNADGALVAGSVTISANNANGITLITNEGAGGLNDIQLGVVTAGTTSAVITLVSDNDILDSDGAVDITAYGLLLEANGSIGTSSDYVDTSVSTIDDRSVSANVRNNIYINETDGVNLGAVNGLSTDIGDVYVTAGGTLTASSVTAGDDGNIYLTTSAGDIAAGLITALGDDVYLNAAGSITDGDTTVDILADRLYLTAGGDVGASGGYLDTKVNNIDDYSATENVAGNIYISEYDGVNLGALISTGLTTDNGSIFVASNATEDGTLTATLVTAGGSGNITLTSQAGASSTGNVNDIAVGLVTAAGDDVTLNSNNDITDLVPDEVTDIVADGLYLAANGTIGGKGNGLELDTRVSTIDDISGSNVHENIYIIEYDGVSLGSINGLTTDTGDIDITAANSAAGDMNAVSLTASGEGNILLTTLDGGTGTNSINVGLITAEGDDVSLVSDADIADSDTTGLDIVSGTLHLQTNGAVGASANYLDTRVANIDDYTGGNVGTDLYISEYDGVILGALNTTTGLSTTNGEIRVVAAVTAAGDLTAQTLTAAGTGKDIYLTTDNGGNGSNTIGLGVVTASGDDIYLNSDWNITDSDLDLTADLISSGLYFTAQGSFGGSGNPARIETTVDTIDDYSLGVNTAANIYISETDAVTLGSIFGLTTDAGVIDIVAGGTITTGTLAANGGFGIFLNSTSGDLLDLEGGSFTATARSELRTGGIIGTIENPYNVNVTAGGLWVWAGSQNREVSANLRGTVVSSSDTERVEIFEPSPPGLVILNNHLMGGGNYGSGSANGSILSRGYGYIDIVRNDLIDSIYARALQQPWGYKLLLAWALAEGPKVDEKFMSDIPAVIDVSALNLPILYMDTNKPMDYYVIRSIK
ncbi:MAG: filamentous hemagglutinin N-terminal domain-containing protein [Candidatus Omnitrophota bacterium]